MREDSNPGEGNNAKLIRCVGAIAIESQFLCENEADSSVGSIEKKGRAKAYPI